MQKQVTRRGVLIAAVFLALIVISPLPLLAHHGWGGYADQEFKLTGTVESPVRLAGPHATMKLRAEGHVWDVVLAPPPRTQAAGLVEKTIPVGAQVTVHGHR